MRPLGIAALLLVSLGLATSCSESRAHGRKAAENEAAATQPAGEQPAAAAPVAANDCDATLWQHVYKPDRLGVISQCTTASGVIADPRPDDDGDMHANLMLDPGQSNMVNKRNAKKKNGGLVIEIVCSVQPKSPKSAIKACNGYHATLSIPAAGAHVRVTGTLVNDSHNGWLEIHPVSRIEPLK